jgi:pimeloyl-ACP methyl ester carboxylesterase
MTSVSANGEEIVFTNAGEGDVALVFIHGWGNIKEIWKDQVAYFSENYQVIAIDLPGFGESTHNRTEWTMQAFGSDVQAVIDQLELDKVVLVGFSMGCAVALEAAQLAGDELLGVVLVDQMKDPSIYYNDEMVQGITGFLRDIVENPTKEKLVAGGFVTQNIDASYERIMTMLDPEASRVGWYESVADLFKWENERDEMLLKETTAPLALINADFQPMNLDTIRSIVPDIQIDVVKGSGHVIMWDFPDQFHAILEKDIDLFMK